MRRPEDSAMLPIFAAPRPRVLGVAALLVALCFGLPSPGATDAQSIPLLRGCQDVFAVEGMRFDGLPMEPFTWDGDLLELGSFAGQPAVVCRAGGPPNLLPITQSIGCLVIGAQLPRVDGNLACGAYRGVQPADGGLFWIARNNAVTDTVTRLRWTGSEFTVGTTYLACGNDSLTPVQDSQQCRP
jgi:hypothetical protein